MTADDLSTPLGQGPRKKPHAGFRGHAPQLIAGMVALAAVLFALWTMLVDSRYGAQQSAGAPIAPPAAAISADKAEPSPPAAAALRRATSADPVRADDGPTGSIPAAEAGSEPKAEPGMMTITIIDGSNGKRRQIQVPDPDAAKAPSPAR